MSDRIMTLHCNECNQWVVFFVDHRKDGCYAICTNCNDLFFMSEEEIDIKNTLIELARYLELAREQNNDLCNLNTYGDHINPPEFNTPVNLLQN